MIDFKNIDHLYHFTSFENAIKIIASKELKFSKMDAINDINEQNGPEILGDKKDIRSIQKALGSYTQISFTGDKREAPVKYGFDIPAMWGHYANKGNGVCLVLRKDLLIKNVERRSRTLYSKEIDYVNYLNPQDFLYCQDRYGSVESFIDEAKDTLFFHKSKDWEYEQEYRVISIDKNPKPLDIHRSLVGVILHSCTTADFQNKVEYRIFSKIDGNLDLYRYSTALDKGTLYNAKGGEVNPTYLNISSVKGAEYTDEQ